MRLAVSATQHITAIGENWLWLANMEKLSSKKI